MTIFSTIATHTERTTAKTTTMISQCIRRTFYSPSNLRTCTNSIPKTRFQSLHLPCTTPLMNPKICLSFSTVVSRVSEQELEQLHHTFPSSLSPSISDLKVPFKLGKSGKKFMLEHDDSIIRNIPDFVARVPRAVQKRKMNNIEPGSCTDPVARLFRYVSFPTCCMTAKALSSIKFPFLIHWCPNCTTIIPSFIRTSN